MANSSDRPVRQFRQSLLWPLQLAPRSDGKLHQPCDALSAPGGGNPWREIVDELNDAGAARFREEHYREFVTFLPYTQRFLYGEGRAARGGDNAGVVESPLRVFRRQDVAAVRMAASADEAPVTFTVDHIDLYFFFDLDVFLLNVEVTGENLTLGQAQDALYRFGRAYPAGWDDGGEGLHCMRQVEWLDANGQVLAASDSSDSERFLSFVRQHRVARISAHWEWLLRPLTLDTTGAEGTLRYRQLEYYRMPVLAYLAVEEPRSLSRDDFVRLALVAAPGDDPPPLPEHNLAEFEARYAYDRFWCEAGLAPYTRYLCCGTALVVVGDAQSAYFTNREAGVLGQFRHQHFLLFLIAHFQKAALLMFSDRLVDALNHLDITSAASVKRFKRAVRELFEVFLRFTHRYWIHEVSEQPQAKALFHLCAKHLDLDALYLEVRERIHDMNHYLDTDSLRRQANTVVRLTVVTAFGLIGTVATGFLGMNLIAEADAPLWKRVAMFAFVLGATIVLTVYTITKSKPLSDFLDALSDERLSARAKVGALLAVWGKRKD